MNVKMTREQAKRMAKLANHMSQVIEQTYDQNSWGKGNMKKIDSFSPYQGVGQIEVDCQTQACVLGHATNVFPEFGLRAYYDDEQCEQLNGVGQAVFKENGKWKFISPDFDKYDEECEAFSNKAVQDFFGINRDQAHRLFGPNSTRDGCPLPKMTPKEKAAQIRQVINENS